MIGSPQGACPRCALPLEQQAVHRRVAYACGRCGGHGASMSVVRESVGPAAFREFWRRARRRDRIGEARCPLCRDRMSVIRFPAHVALDVCDACQFVWYDPGERTASPDAPPPDEPSTAGRAAHPDVELAATLLRVRKQVEERRKQGIHLLELPEWQILPALLGLPVERDARPAPGRPWITWGLALACAVFLAVTFHDLARVVAAYGLVPADPWRHLGVTWFTSAFLHAGVAHLLGNAYFLLVLGDNVEGDLGKPRFVALFVAALLAGNALHVLLDPRSGLPLVGASGAISGILAYYVLKFPRQRVSMVLAGLFMTLPVWGYALVWVGLQLVGVLRQLSGSTTVSSVAHLGGAAAGLLAWIVWRSRAPSGDWPR